MDSKSIGLCPQGFESPRCRFHKHTLRGQNAVVPSSGRMQRSGPSCAQGASLQQFSSWHSSLTLSPSPVASLPLLCSFRYCACFLSRHFQIVCVLSGVLRLTKTFPINTSTVRVGPFSTARLALSAEHKARNLVVVGSSPTVGVFQNTKAATCFHSSFG